MKIGTKVKLLHVTTDDGKPVTGKITSDVLDAEHDDIVVNGTRVLVQLDDGPFEPFAVSTENVASVRAKS